MRRYVVGVLDALQRDGSPGRHCSERLGRQQHFNATQQHFGPKQIESDVGWATAVAGADYVLHLASPVPSITPNNDDEVIRPARDGTLRVLKASRDAGVRRGVMTSSIAAIAYGRGERAQPFSEEEWTDETNLKDTSPYSR